MKAVGTALGLRFRLVAVVACAGALAAVLVPGAEAQKVANPGPFSITPTTGEIEIRDLKIDLTPQPMAQCSDGVDNDGDGRIDVADGGCAAGAGSGAAADDNELAPGFQAKESVRLEGTIDAAGNVQIPVSGVSLPTAYVPVVGPFDGITYVVTAKVVPTHPATGKLDPISGAAELRVRFRVALTGEPLGIGLGATCSIGTDAAPIDINVLTTGAATGPPPLMKGSVYSNGALTVVNNDFAVPGASGCPVGLLDVNAIISQQMALPSPPGANKARIVGTTSPLINKGISPVIDMTPASLGLGGPIPSAPQFVVFDASRSAVAKGPASYRWEFTSGTTYLGTLSGPVVSKTFEQGGTITTRVWVTDADGDVVMAARNFVLNPPVPTTTTTTTTIAPTTTVPPTTTTTTTTIAPTTTVPPTTTTTVKPTTTTTAPTTTTTVRPTTTVSVPPATTTTTVKPTTTTTVPPTTTTVKPTTTTTTAKPTTTTTAKPTTTVSVPPATTTTTAKPTTTTTTVKPTTTTTQKPTTTLPGGVGARDRVDLKLNGSQGYVLSGELLTGDLVVGRRDGAFWKLEGGGTLRGPKGGVVTVAMEIHQLWVLPIWIGGVGLEDPASGVFTVAPFVGQPDSTGSQVSGEMDWYLFGPFPDLIRPMNLRWSAVDGS